MIHRYLSDHEISTLERRGCSATNWNEVHVKDPFLPERLRNVHFSGMIKLGSNAGRVEVHAAMFKDSGITNCDINGCTVGDNVYFRNVGTLANYMIGKDVVLENVGALMVLGETTFGNGHEIDVLNEGGGRELPIFDRLSAQIAYLMVVYRHDKRFTARLKSLVDAYVCAIRSTYGVIGNGSKIREVNTIVNVNIGECAHIRGASMLKEGSIVSKRVAPALIGENVTAENFIVQSGSVIDGGAFISSAFVGQGVKIGKQFSAVNAAFFANCEAYHGEACSVFAGPYTVTHHKSTLLIAGMFSFYNAGSGTNQSNHMYKLGALHQGIVERGSKTGSFSYMLWPCRVGAFSVVMDKHGVNFDTTEFPFSYLTVENGKSVLTPAMNLTTVGVARDSKKFPARDRRKDAEKLDLIHFDLFNPHIAGKIMQGMNILEQLHQETPKTREFAYHKGIHINRLMLKTARRYYEMALTVYLGGELVGRLQNCSSTSLDEVKRRLLPDGAARQTSWVDLAGMFAEKESIEKLTGLINAGTIASIGGLHEALRLIFEEYAKKSWGWCVAALKQWKGLDVENLSAEALMAFLADWRSSAARFISMVLKDAGKEFDKLSMTGFGHDGDEAQKLADFEAIRGSYEENSFVVDLKKELEDIERVYAELHTALEKLS